jgi:hypothetical protein
MIRAQADKRIRYDLAYLEACRACPGCHGSTSRERPLSAQREEDAAMATADCHDGDYAVLPYASW